MQQTATGRIRIMTVPAGEAPLWVREAWLGLELPCDPYLGYPNGELERGVVTGEEAQRNRCGYSVPQVEALAALENTSPQAAAWWRAQGFPQPDKCFGFAENEAEIVNGVTRQRIREWRECMGVDPEC